MIDIFIAATYAFLFHIGYQVGEWTAKQVKGKQQSKNKVKNTLQTYKLNPAIAKNYMQAKRMREGYARHVTGQVLSFTTGAATYNYVGGLSNVGNTAVAAVTADDNTIKVYDVYAHEFKFWSDTSDGAFSVTPFLLIGGPNLTSANTDTNYDDIDEAVDAYITASDEYTVIAGDPVDSVRDPSGREVATFAFNLKPILNTLVKVNEQADVNGGIVPTAKLSVLISTGVFSNAIKYQTRLTEVSHIKQNSPAF
jgi:hypothetical protein